MILQREPASAVLWGTGDPLGPLEAILDCSLSGTLPSILMGWPDSIQNWHTIKAERLNDKVKKNKKFNTSIFTPFLPYP
jgi:hypothetical protein